MIALCLLHRKEVLTKFKRIEKLKCHGTRFQEINPFLSVEVRSIVRTLKRKIFELCKQDIVSLFPFRLFETKLRDQFIVGIIVAFNLMNGALIMPIFFRIVKKHKRKTKQF